MMKFANPARMAGFVLLCWAWVGAAWADTQISLSPRIADMAAGLFCAAPDAQRRPAPETMAGWVHVPAEPVLMIAEGHRVPAVMGIGFGVRYALLGTETAHVRYTITHPPMPPSGLTTQSWETTVRAGFSETVFFQFDHAEELQLGAWSFSALADGELLFTIGFTVQPPATLPALAGLCQDGTMMSFSPADHAARG